MYVVILGSELVHQTLHAVFPRALCGRPHESFSTSEVRSSTRKCSWRYVVVLCTRSTSTRVVVLCRVSQCSEIKKVSGMRTYSYKVNKFSSSCSMCALRQAGRQAGRKVCARRPSIPHSSAGRCRPVGCMRRDRADGRSDVGPFSCKFLKANFELAKIVATAAGSSARRRDCIKFRVSRSIDQSS